MLYLIFLYNVLNPAQINRKIAVYVLILPNIFFWYMFIIYNNFFSINPFQYELLIFVLFSYLYVLFYILFNT